MASSTSKWAALLHRLSADNRFDVATLHQGWLRRQVAARMRLRGVGSQEAYLSLLEGSPGEYGALCVALQSAIQRAGGPAGAPIRHAWRMPLQRWVDTIPVPALVAEAVPATGSLRLLASNALARDSLGRVADALRATGDRSWWLFPDQSPCAEEDMPLYQAIWRGVSTHDKNLVLRDAAGRLWPLAVSARRVPGGRPARAIATVQAARAWEAESGPAALLPLFNQAQTLRARYQSLFEEGVDPAFLTDGEGVVEEANREACALLQAQRKEIAGRPLAGSLLEEALPAFAEALQAALEGGEARARLRLRAHSERVLEAHVRRMPVDEGALLAWVLRDVTSLAEAEQQRRDLVDLVLHDLRSPLATALLGLEAIERSLEHGDRTRSARSLSMTAAALRRLGRVVDSLLDVSRLEEGQPMLRPTEVDVGELLGQVAQEAAMALDARGLELRMEVPADLPAIAADADMLFRAVINLLDNAIRFSPPGGQVQLRAAREDDGLAIAVADQGPAVPAELLPRIFDKFVGLHLPGAPRGYGLGLSFCRLAADAHGGRVAVESQPGWGSTFTLWLPAGQAPIQP